MHFFPTCMQGYYLVLEIILSWNINTMKIGNTLNKGLISCFVDSSRLELIG